MLQKLTIKNIALISESVIEFDKGLNILTGETGAGKSLIIDSLNFVLGARADKSLIKSGEEFAQVIAVFVLEKINSEIKEFFNSIFVEPETTIIISRYLNINGKTEIKVNGQTVTNSMLKKLTSLLVDIHGQHSHQALLDVKNHIDILDSFNQTKINDIKQELQTFLNELKNIDKTIEEIGGSGLDRERNIDLLKYQIEEIENANLKENEEEELIARKTFLLNAEKIYNSLTSASNILKDSDTNILTMLKVAINNIKLATTYDENVNLIYDKLNSLYYDLMDESEKISDIVNSANFDENELNTIEERLDLIKNLKRKYGSNYFEIITYLQNAKLKLNNLINAEEELQKLSKQRKDTLIQIYNVCQKLTQTRKEIANKLNVLILNELKDLGMKNSNFSVEFNSYNFDEIEKTVTPNGADNLEFMFSANLGEPLKPLSKIISGGEMSRFMLGIKCVINENSNKTFVFDEIDNGIGGLVGLIVAKKLSKISKNNQVICVTHLAQIASFADVHFNIYKCEENGKTKTTVKQLNNNEIVLEVARLLGSTGTNAGIEHAQELLTNAKSFKLN